jgi:predicted TIM-barrel enzyme
MAAQAAERAGADFILALGAGKMRSMGVASPASLLPVYDGVEFTIDFALTEILPRTRLPVFVGLPLFDPRIEPEPLVQRLKSIGIRGLTNFPAVFHLGVQASALEELGYGRSREVAFLSAAARAGLETIGYVRSRSDAMALIRAGISTLCVNFSLNPHRHQDAETAEMLDRTTVALRRVTQNLRKPHLSLTFYLGGGPVSGGASMDRLCRNAGIDGFIGGSALDRVPLERSLVNSVASSILSQARTRTGRSFSVVTWPSPMQSCPRTG